VVIVLILIVAILIGLYFLVMESRPRADQEGATSVPPTDTQMTAPGAETPPPAAQASTATTPAAPQTAAPTPPAATEPQPPAAPPASSSSR